MATKKNEPQLSLSQILAKASSDLKTAVNKPNIWTHKPHDKQRVFHANRLREKLFIGGNRSGKTVSNVVECCWWLTKKHPYREDVNNIEGPIRGRYVSVDFKQGIDKIAIPYFKQYLPASELVEGSWEKSYDNYRNVLTLANGSFIEFMSYEQSLEKFAGTSRHFTSFDEEPPQPIFVECRMRLVDTKGSWWISMTPVEGISWIHEVFYEPWEKNERPQLMVLEINTGENPYVDETEMDAALDIVADGEKSARKEGKFVAFQGKVYPNFRPTVHKRHDFALSEGMVIYSSYDHGWKHPAAWLWHAVEPNGRVTTFHELIVSEKTIAELAAEVKLFEATQLAPAGFKVSARPCDPACGQTSGINGLSIQGEYATKHQLYLSIPETRGKNSVDVGLDKVQQYLRVDPELNTPMWQYTPDCTVLERQMTKLRWKKWQSKKLEYENGPRNEIHKVDDDGPDSLRYFFTFMPELYVTVAGVEQRIRTSVGHMWAAQPVGHIPMASANDVPLPDKASDYIVYEGSDLYSLENY